LSASSTSLASRKRSFRLVEPALTTSTRTASGIARRAQ
jgi:hypothetical protein